MNTIEMNSAEIIRMVDELPELPRVQAIDMLTAQSYIPTEREREAIAKRADFFEAVGLSRTVSLVVVDNEGAAIGLLRFAVKAARHHRPE